MLTRRQLFAISLAVASVAATLALDNGLALYNPPPRNSSFFLILSESVAYFIFVFKTTTKT